MTLPCTWFSYVLLTIFCLCENSAFSYFQIAARRVHGKNQDVQRVFKAGLLFGLVAGGLMTLFLLFGADWITVHIFNSPNSALPLKVMAPTILVFSIMGVVRGYFQGLGNMVPTSISQVIEQVVNAVISVAPLLRLHALVREPGNPGGLRCRRRYPGYPFRRAGCLRLPGPADVCVPQTEREGTASSPQADRLESWSHVYTALFLTSDSHPSIPSQFVYQLSGSVDNSMFGFLMSGKGLTEKERLSLLGIYGGKYRLLSNVPVAVASSLGTSMIPSIVRSRAQKNRTDVMYKIRLTIKFNMLIAIPCAFGMAALASPVLRLIFRDSRDLTRNLLMLGAPAVIFFSLSTVTNAVLQGIDLMRKSVTHSAISLVVHAALVYVMLKYLNWGVYGLVIGNVTFALVVCVLNWHAIGKALRYRQEVKTTFLLPCICAAVMSVIAFLVYALVNKVTGYYQIGLLISIPVAMVVYGLLIVTDQSCDRGGTAGYAVRNAHSAAVPEISFDVKKSENPVSEM